MQTQNPDRREKFHQRLRDEAAIAAKYVGVKYDAIPTIKDRVAYLRHHIRNDNKWAIRALLAVYKQQDADEQNGASALRHNGVGFSQYDAEDLTILADKQIAGIALTYEELKKVRFKMARYATQLERLTRHKIKKQLELNT